MIWWLYPVIVYCGITYLIGILISIAYYSLVQEMMSGKDKVIYFLMGLLFTLASPISIPLGIYHFIKGNENKRRKWVTMFYCMQFLLLVTTFCGEEGRRS